MACLADVLSVSLQRYPDASATAFRQVAARIHGLAPDEIVATNGGDELLRLALTTFADPRHPVGIVTPGYGLYSVLAGLHQAPLSEVPLTETWQLPVTTASRWNAARVPDEPARPIGNALSVATIQKLAASFRGVLVIDEAYVDFVDPAQGYDATTLIARYPNVLLLRTLSKGLFARRLAPRLWPRPSGPDRADPQQDKDSYDIDAIAQLLRAVALEDRAHAGTSWEAVCRERDSSGGISRGLGLDVLPSQTNFLLVSVASHGNEQFAPHVYAKLIERNIYVRGLTPTGSETSCASRLARLKRTLRSSPRSARSSAREGRNSDHLGANTSP